VAVNDHSEVAASQVSLPVDNLARIRQRQHPPIARPYYMALKRDGALPLPEICRSTAPSRDPQVKCRCSIKRQVTTSGQSRRVRRQTPSSQPRIHAGRPVGRVLSPHAQRPGSIPPECHLTWGFTSHGFSSVPVSFHALAEQRRNWQISGRLLARSRHRLRTRTGPLPGERRPAG
jgi:hypothetical protein